MCCLFILLNQKKVMTIKTGGVCILLLLLIGCNPTVHDQQQDAAMPESSNWKADVEKTVKLFGHRNWIVVADAAYPQQSHPAIRTIYADADHLEVVEFVNNLIVSSKHVTAQISLDKELAYVPERAAPGVEAYRVGLDKLLAGKPSNKVLHEDIINELDASAKLFNVLIIKTNLAIPYTSVFFRLECGYWDAASEQSLRSNLGTQNE
jgi:hypothetical protein